MKGNVRCLHRVNIDFIQTAGNIKRHRAQRRHKSWLSYGKHNSSADCEGGECEAKAQFICSNGSGRWVIFPLSVFFGVVIFTAGGVLVVTLLAPSAPQIEVSRATSLHIPVFVRMSHTNTKAIQTYLFLSACNMCDSICLTLKKFALRFDGIFK